MAALKPPHAAVPFLSALLVVATACGDNATTTTPAPADGGVEAAALPPCTEDSATEDVVAIDARGPGGGPSPLVRVVADAEGVAALWFDGIQKLLFRRWAADGTPRGETQTIASKLDLPGGDAGLSSIALGHASGAYMVVFEEAATHTLVAKLIAADGTVSDAEKPGIAAAGSQQYKPHVFGHGDGFVVAWTEGFVASNGTGTVLQAFGADGVARSKVAVPPGNEFFGADGDVVDGRLRLVHYKRGKGSIYDTEIVYREADANADLTKPTAFSESVLPLKRPATGDMLRSYLVMASLPDGGAFVVDGVGWEESGDAKRRIEIAEVAPGGVLAADFSIDLPARRRYVANPQVAVRDDVVYVAWIDAEDASAGDSAILHVWRRDRAAGATKTTDVPLSLAKGSGQLDALTRPLGGIAVEADAVRVPWTWRTLDAEARRTTHVGLRAVCMASR